jgi:hypothetical protein
LKPNKLQALVYSKNEKEVVVSVKKQNLDASYFLDHLMHDNQSSPFLITNHEDTFSTHKPEYHDQEVFQSNEEVGEAHQVLSKNLD